MQGAGGVISGAMSLIKEKEKQADNGLDRIHDSLKTQTQTTAAQGSWTGKGGERPTASEPKEVVIKTSSGNGAVKGDKGAAPSTDDGESGDAKDNHEDDADEDDTSKGLDIFRMAEMAK